MARHAPLIAFALFTTCACSSNAPEGTAKRMSECNSLPYRQAHYCNQRLYEEVQAAKRAEKSDMQSKEATR